MIWSCLAKSEGCNKFTAYLSASKLMGDGGMLFKGAEALIFADGEVF